MNKVKAFEYLEKKIYENRGILIQLMEIPSGLQKDTGPQLIALSYPEWPKVPCKAVVAISTQMPLPLVLQNLATVQCLTHHPSFLKNKLLKNKHSTKNSWHSTNGSNTEQNHRKKMRRQNKKLKKLNKEMCKNECERQFLFSNSMSYYCKICSSVIVLLYLDKT